MPAIRLATRHSLRLPLELGRGQGLPKVGLLSYFARPNSDEYLVGEATEVGEDAFIWGYYLGTDTTVRAATGWSAGNANVFYDTIGLPIVCLATEIVTWLGINVGTVLFKMANEGQQTGKLAVYSLGTDAAVLAKAKAILKIT